MMELALWRKINENFSGGEFVSSGRYGTQKRSKIAQIKARSVSERLQWWPISVLEDETSSRLREKMICACMYKKKPKSEQTYEGLTSEPSLTHRL